MRVPDEKALINYKKHVQKLKKTKKIKHDFIVGSACIEEKKFFEFEFYTWDKNTKDYVSAGKIKTSLN